MLDAREPGDEPELLSDDLSVVREAPPPLYEVNAEDIAARDE